ncbi:hypothetical protein B0T17DRAFT_593977 [Bombardia bombarda]|uniref:Uncharacterized protein n=1 Tax=Bombardia bombarda TaxID=252184 RepID=A0AA39W3T9_9PEZI|nr:hypothetical protein B0T17DRAFT_593977 [Bombardia bombarda]
MMMHKEKAAGFHLPDFEALLVLLRDAVNAAWPTRSKKRYTKVKVLLISWDKDDLGVSSEIAALKSVFEGLYHYEVEGWKIPSIQAPILLAQKIANLLQTEGEKGNLIILYYAGHARPNEQPGGSPVWVANRSRDSPKLQSSVLHSLLGEIDCDVLLLYDCCHAIQAGEALSGEGVVETLAACGFESIAAGVGDHSFTSSFIDELAEAARTQKWLSVVELHRQLINRLQAWKSKVRFTDDTNSTVALDERTGRPLFEPPYRRTPIYCFLSKKPRTILLSPLPASTLSNSRQEFVLLNTPTIQQRQIPSRDTEVLISVRLRGDRLSAERWKQWKEWLLEAPPEAQGITIDAAYPSGSVMLVLKIPLVVWDLLPDSPAISFIGYATGENCALEFNRLCQEDSDGDVEMPRNSQTGTGIIRKSSWPRAFERGQGKFYRYETESAYYDERNNAPDGTSNLTSKEIIDAFTESNDDPSRQYLCDEVRAFCSPANFNVLLSGGHHHDAASAVAIVDDRLPDNDGASHDGLQFLNRYQLFNALRNETISEEKREGPVVARRRLLYVANLDSWTALSIIAAASHNQAFFLKDFVYKYITFPLQPTMGVQFKSSGSQAFQLSFHLPFLAWRKGDGQHYLNTENGSEKKRRPLRYSNDVSFLDQSEGRASSFIHQAQFSCMVTGVDKHFWTAYGFFDTYHDRGESKYDVHQYADSDSEDDSIEMDPLTGRRHAADTPIWTPREYFLRVLESCINEAKHEWLNVGMTLLKKITPYVRLPAMRRMLT